MKKQQQQRNAIYGSKCVVRRCLVLRKPLLRSDQSVLRICRYSKYISFGAPNIKHTHSLALTTVYDVNHMFGKANRNSQFIHEEHDQEQEQANLLRVDHFLYFF